MPEMRTEIVINAPKELVWDILTNFEEYQYWNPMVPSAKTRGGLGSKIKLKLHINGIDVPVTAKIMDFSKNRRFSWGGPGVKLAEPLVSAEHYFEIEEINESQCRLIHGETFGGLLPRLAWRMLKGLERSYGELNEALKREAEDRA